jgi:hypothetical protein
MSSVGSRYPPVPVGGSAGHRVAKLGSLLMKAHDVQFGSLGPVVARGVVHECPALAPDGEGVRNLLVLVGHRDDGDQRVRTQEGRSLREERTVDSLIGRLFAADGYRGVRVGLNEEPVPGLVHPLESASVLVDPRDHPGEVGDELGDAGDGCRRRG